MGVQRMTQSDLETASFMSSQMVSTIPRSEALARLSLSLSVAIISWTNPAFDFRAREKEEPIKPIPMIVILWKIKVLCVSE